MNNKIIIGLFAGVLILSGLTAWRTTTTPPPTPQPSQSQYGSVASPDIQSTWIKVGGVLEYHFHADFAGTATSTPCVFQAPPATSTLRYASLRIGTASTTATTWTVAKATGANATTTVLTTFPQLGSGAQGTMVATTTPGTEVAGSTPKPDIDGAVVFAPNQYLVWGVKGLTYTGYDATLLGGSCDAVFIVN